METPGSARHDPRSGHAIARGEQTAHTRELGNHERAGLRARPFAPSEAGTAAGCGRGPMVGRAAAGDRRSMRIVCSIDDSAHARDAARIAGELALRLDAELVHVHSVTGDATGGSGKARCDLLIVGYKPRGRWRNALLGAAHRRLVEDAPCPVMLVPAGARLSADRSGRPTVGSRPRSSATRPTRS